MCFYVVQEAKCSFTGCQKKWYVKVYRAPCLDPELPIVWTDFCASDSTWIWVQRDWQTDYGLLPLSRCADCRNESGETFHIIAPSSVEIEPANCPCNMPSGFCFGDCGRKSSSMKIEWDQRLEDDNDLFGENLHVFARYKLAYERACSIGYPSAASNVSRFISDAEIELEVKRIEESRERGVRLDGTDEESEKIIAFRRSFKEAREERMKTKAAALRARRSRPA